MSHFIRSVSKPYKSLIPFFFLILVIANIQVQAQQTTWNGSTWSNGEPDANTDAVIASSTSPGTFSANNVTIDSGFELSVISATTINITGDLTNNGNGLSGTGTIAFDSDGNTLEISGSAVSFEGVIDVLGTTVLQTNGNLTLSASSSTDYGMITGGGTINGSVTAQAWLDLSGGGNDGRYYQLGAPFTNATLNDYNEGQEMISEDSQAGSAWHWDAENAEWDPAGSGNLSSTADIGRGYAIYAGTNSNDTYLRNGPGVVELSGDITTTDVTQSLSYNDGQSSSVTFVGGSGESDTEGWNLLANPYLAQYDWDGQSFPANVSSAKYTWTGSNYTSYTQGAGSGNRYIPPFQGFFVQLTENTPGNFTFEADEISSGQSAELHKSVSSYEIDGVDLHIEGKGGEVHDELFIGFEQEATNAFDNEWDARKLQNASHVPNFYVTLNETAYSICRVPYDDLTTFSLNLDYQDNGDQVTIYADQSRLNSFDHVILEDLKTGEKQDLSSGDYTFIHDSEYDSNRFKVHFSQQTTTSNEPDQEPEKFTLDQNYPNPFNPVTTIKYSVKTNAHVQLQVFNTMGQKVAELVDKQHSAGTYTVTWDASGFSSGIYYYHLQSAGQILTRKMTLIK